MHVTRDSVVVFERLFEMVTDYHLIVEYSLVWNSMNNVGLNFTLTPEDNVSQLAGIST